MANNDAKTKQVLILRGDLDINLGKIASQLAHASLGAILNKNTSENRREVFLELEEYEEEWFNDRFTKIVLVAKDENQLLEIYDKARANGINCSKIIDKGFTFFNGKPTLTAIGLGPHYKEELDLYTKDLSVLKETKKEAEYRKMLQKLYKKLKKTMPEEAEKIKGLLWGKK